MSTFLLIGQLLPKLQTEQAINNLHNVYLPLWKEKAKVSFEFATFGALEGNLFLCLVITEYVPSDMIAILLRDKSVKVMTATDPLLFELASILLLTKAKAAWEIVQNVVRESVSVILQDDVLFVLTNGYPIHRVR